MIMEKKLNVCYRKSRIFTPNSGIDTNDVCVCVCMYIYTERERENIYIYIQRESVREQIYVYIHTVLPVPSLTVCLMLFTCSEWEREK
jgi:hypothetical protein